MTVIVETVQSIEQLSAAINTRRLRKCIAQDAHTSVGTCPRCGLTEGTK